MFVFETVFISEQIGEHKFEALLKISNTFISELSVFSYMYDFVVQASKKKENFVVILYGFEKHSTRHCVKSVQIRSYFWSVFSCTRTKYGDLRSVHAMSLTLSRR